MYSADNRSKTAEPMEKIALRLKQLRKNLAVFLLATTLFSTAIQADEGQKSSVATVGKSTFYCALTGLLVGIPPLWSPVAVLLGIAR